MSSRAVSVKKSMIQNAVNQLQKSDFEVYNYNLPDIELCFELLARHQSHAFPSLLLKFCENIDRLKPHTTQELKLLSHIISAMPVLIGRKNRRDNLQDNIVYERENLIAINDVTFKKIINSPEYPLALAKRG